MSANTILILVAIAFAQSMFWLIFYTRVFDFRDREPKRLLAMLFLWGIWSIAPILIIEYGARILLQTDTDNFSALLTFGVLIAVIEEYLKYIVTLLTVWHSKYFNQIVDGIIYTVTVALGFAFVENLFLLLKISENHSLTSGFVLSTILLRFFLTTLLHTITAGVIGYALGKSRFMGLHHRDMLRILFALIFATGLHAVFNGFMAKEEFLNATAIIVPVFIFLVIQFFRMPNMRVRKKPQEESEPFI